MTYVPSHRDFDFQPRNQYAALRMGVAGPAKAPMDASDLHRISSRIVSATVVGVIVIAAAVLLPSTLAAFGDVTSIYDVITAPGQ